MWRRRAAHLHAMYRIDDDTSARYHVWGRYLSVLGGQVLLRTGSAPGEG